MPTKSVSMVKLDNFPVFSTKTQKNQLLQKKSQNSPWTNISHLASNFFFFSLKKSTDSLKLLYEMEKRKEKKIDVKARTTVPCRFGGI
jgi:hypothetical protein